MAVSAFTLFGEIKIIVDKMQRDLKSAEQDLQKARKEIEKTEDAGKEASLKLAELGASAKKAGTIAGAAFGAMSAAITTTAVALFELMRATSDFGSAIHDAAQQTGLSTKTMSALQYAAEQSGSSMEQITGAVGKFNALLGEAAIGNEKAAATLDAFKITAHDTESALKQAIQTIAKEADATKQAAIAKELFKDRVGDILPVIQSFSGDLPGLMTKLEKMGYLMSQEDADAADAFGDALGDLSKQAGVVGRRFATEMMPAVTDTMQEISDWLAQNKDDIKQWGQAGKKEILEVKTGVLTLHDAFNLASASLVTELVPGMDTATTVMSALARGVVATTIPFYELIRVIGEAKRAYDDWKVGGTSSGEQYGPFASDMTGNAKGRIGGTVDSEKFDELADKAAKAAEKAAKKAAQELEAWNRRETAAALEVAEFTMRDAERIHDDFTKQLISGIGSYWSITTSQYKSAVEQLDVYTSEVEKAITKVTELEDAKREGMTPSEVDALNQTQDERWRKAAAQIQENIDKFQAAIDNGKTDLEEGMLANIKAFGQREKQFGESLLDYWKPISDQIKADIAEIDAEMGEPPPAKKWTFFWYEMRKGINEFKNSLPSLKQALGDNLLNAFTQIGDVFANAVAQWDGTAKGFFKSLAAGFRQLISQLISELIRLMVMKAVMSLLGGILGGASGSGGHQVGVGTVTGNAPTNIGGTGASPMGGLAAAFAGDAMGPSMAMAGASSSTFNNSITVNMPGGSGSSVTAEQVARVVISQLSKFQGRNK